MGEIKANTLEVIEIFDRVIVTLTEKMLSQHLKRQAEFVPIRTEGFSFVIRTEGAFVSLIRFDMEILVFEWIASDVYKGKEITEQEKKLYVSEYMNIVCGRALSEINNILGKRSRLSIPFRIDKNDISSKLAKKEKISYQCCYGYFNFIIYFEEVVEGGN